MRYDSVTEILEKISFGCRESLVAIFGQLSLLPFCRPPGMKYKSVTDPEIKIFCKSKNSKFGFRLSEFLLVMFGQLSCYQPSLWPFYIEQML